MKLFKRLFPQKYYWYSVKYTYRKNGEQILNWTTEIGVVHKHDILNDRRMKKAETPLHKMPIEKRLLCNGTLGVTRLAYLGRFKQPIQRTTKNS